MITKKVVDEKVNDFINDYTDAPQFGYRSRLSKKRIPGRYDLKVSFCDSLVMLKLIADTDTCKYIDGVVAKLERM